ncbi:MAG: hypothetical protein KAR03_03750 [Candidatus Thorarchaeota archaeon]|nr:hypothetical protein [Candidatus Thorarchaeota archaeon]
MPNRKILASIIILITVLGVGVYVLLSGTPQVQPPSSPPGDDPYILISHDLEVSAEAIYWQDFMPSFSQEGPPFMTVIWVNVTNTGNTTVSNFEAVRLTIYFSNTSMPLVTLNLIPTIDWIEWPQIGPGESIVLEFTNDRSSVFSPIIEEDTVLYSLILIRWGYGIEGILTTPTSALGYTH